MFFVIKKKICSKCVGTGVVQYPIWKAYWEWERKFRTEFSRLPNREEDRGWWADRGFYENAAYPENVIPPEEQTCPWCEGVGVRSEEVELSVALKELGIGVPQDEQP